MAKEPFVAKTESLWIGGFFFWMIKGFKGKLADQYNEEFNNRNIWTGYTITLIFTGIIVYFMIRNEL
jgi:Na+-driven multidrug efflux pump